MIIESCKNSTVLDEDFFIISIFISVIITRNCCTSSDFDDLNMFQFFCKPEPKKA